jgi:hypothetical protein
LSNSEWRTTDDGLLVPSRLAEIEKEQIEAKKRDGLYKAEQLKLERKLVQLNIWLVVVGFCGIGLAFWQTTIAQDSAVAAKTAADAARDGLVETRKATAAAETAARAAENQLPIQIRQLDIARDQMAASNQTATAQLDSQRNALRLERRAWVGADQALKPFVQAGRPVAVSVQIVNTGQSPGLRVESNNRLVPVELGQAFKPEFPDLPTRPSSPALLPGMRTTATVVSNWTVTDARLSAIKDGKLTVYLYGRITYRDIFNQPREGGYCMTITRDLSGLQFCDDHNYAR